MDSNLSLTAKQTRENIMSAFWELYTNDRIEKITVTKICERAGYNRSTFYTYFKDVYDVLEQIEEQIITPESFEKSVATYLFTDNKALAYQHIIQLFEDSSSYFPVLLGEHGDTGFRHKLMRKLIPPVSKHLNVNFNSNAKLKYILEYQSAAILNTIISWYANGKDIPTEEFIQLLIGITMNGVQSELVKNISYF